MLRGEKYTIKADLWSYGVVMWEILTAKIPFDGMARAELAHKVAIDGMRLPPPQNAPLPLLRLMANLWHRPSKRPDFARVLAVMQQAEAELAQRLSGESPV